MPEQNRNRPKPRPRSDSDSGPTQRGVRPPNADELLEIAGELEEQARAMLSRARQLQRLAQGMDQRPDRGIGGFESRPSRGGTARPSGGTARPKRQGPAREGAAGARPKRAGGPREGSARGRGDGERGAADRPERGGSDRPERGGSRGKGGRGDAPSWAPTPKKRRS